MNKQENKIRRMVARLVSTRRRKIIMMGVMASLLVVLYRVYEITHFVLKLSRNPLEMSVRFIEVDDRNSSIFKVVLSLPNTVLPMEVKFGTIRGEMFSVGNDVQRLFKYGSDKIMIRKKQDINDAELSVMINDLDLSNLADVIREKRIILTEYMFMIYVRFCFIPLYFNVVKTHVFNDGNAGGEVVDGKGTDIEAILNLFDIQILNGRLNKNVLILRVEADREQLSRMLANLSSHFSICELEMRFSPITIYTDVMFSRQVYIVPSMYKDEMHDYGDSRGQKIGPSLVMDLDDKELCDFLGEILTKKRGIAITGVSYKDTTYMFRRKFFVYGDDEFASSEDNELHLNDLDGSVVGEETIRNPEMLQLMRRSKQLYRERKQVIAPEAKTSIFDTYDNYVVETVRRIGKDTLAFNIGVGPEVPFATALLFAKKCLSSFKFRTQFLLPCGEIASLRFGLCKPGRKIDCERLTDGWFSRHNAAVSKNKPHGVFYKAFWVELEQVDLGMIMHIRVYGNIFIKITDNLGRFQILTRNVFLYTLNNSQLRFLVANEQYILYRKEKNLENKTVLDLTHTISGDEMMYCITSQSGAAQSTQDFFCCELDKLVGLTVDGTRLQANACFSGTRVWYDKTTESICWTLNVVTILRFYAAACMPLRPDDLWSYFDSADMVYIYGLCKVDALLLHNIEHKWRQANSVTLRKRYVECATPEDATWWARMYCCLGDRKKVMEILKKDFTESVSGGQPVHILPLALHFDALESSDSIHFSLSGAHPSNGRIIGKNISNKNENGRVGRSTDPIFMRLQNIMARFKGVMINDGYNLAIRNTILLQPTLFNMTTSNRKSTFRPATGFRNMDDLIRSGVAVSKQQLVESLRRGSSEIDGLFSGFIRNNFMLKSSPQGFGHKLNVIKSLPDVFATPTFSIAVHPLRVHFDLYDGVGFVYVSGRTKINLLVAYHMLLCTKSVPKIRFTESRGMLETTIGLFINKALDAGSDEHTAVNKDGVQRKDKHRTMNKPYGVYAILASIKLSVIKKASATIVCGSCHLTDDGHVLQLCDFLALENIDRFMISVVAMNLNPKKENPFFSFTAGINVGSTNNSNVSSTNNSNVGSTRADKKDRSRSNSSFYFNDDLYYQEKHKGQYIFKRPRMHRSLLENTIEVSRDGYTVAINNDYVTVNNKIITNNQNFDSEVNNSNNSLGYKDTRYTEELFFPVCGFCSALWNAQKTDDSVKVWLWQHMRVCTTCSACPRCCTLLNAWNLWTRDGVLVASCSFCKIQKSCCKGGVRSNTQLCFEGVFCDKKVLNIGTISSKNYEVGLVMHINDDCAVLNYSDACLEAIFKHDNFLNELLVRFRNMAYSGKKCDFEEKIANAVKTEPASQATKDDERIDELVKIFNEIYKYLTNTTLLNVEIEDIKTGDNTLVPQVSISTDIVNRGIHSLIKWLAYYSPFVRMVPKKIDLDCIVDVPRAFMLEMREGFVLRFEEARAAVSHVFSLRKETVVGTSKPTDGLLKRAERDPNYTNAVIRMVNTNEVLQNQQHIFVGNGRTLLYGSLDQNINNTLALLPNANSIGKEMQKEGLLKKMDKNPFSTMDGRGAPEDATAYNHKPDAFSFDVAAINCWKIDFDYKSMNEQEEKVKKIKYILYKKSDENGNSDNNVKKPNEKRKNYITNTIIECNAENLDSKVCGVCRSNLKAKNLLLIKYSPNGNTTNEDEMSSSSKYVDCENLCDNAYYIYNGTPDAYCDWENSYDSVSDIYNETSDSCYDFESPCEHKSINNTNGSSSEFNASNSNDSAASTGAPIGPDKVSGQFPTDSDRDLLFGKFFYLPGKKTCQIISYVNSIIILSLECLKHALNKNDNPQKGVAKGAFVIETVKHIIMFFKDKADALYEKLVKGELCDTNLNSLYRSLEKSNDYSYAFLKTLALIITPALLNVSNEYTTEPMPNHISSRSSRFLANAHRYRDLGHFELCSPGFVSHYDIKQVTTNDKIMTKALRVCTRCLISKSGGEFKAASRKIVMAYDAIAQMQHRETDALKNKDTSQRSMFSSLVEYYRVVDPMFYNELLLRCDCDPKTENECVVGNNNNTTSGGASSDECFDANNDEYFDAKSDGTSSDECFDAKNDEYFDVESDGTSSDEYFDAENDEYFDAKSDGTSSDEYFDAENDEYFDAESDEYASTNNSSAYSMFYRVYGMLVNLLNRISNGIRGIRDMPERLVGFAKKTSSNAYKSCARYISGSNFKTNIFKKDILTIIRLFIDLCRGKKWVYANGKVIYINNAEEREQVAKEREQVADEYRDEISLEMNNIAEDSVSIDDYVRKNKDRINNYMRDNAIHDPKMHNANNNIKQNGCKDDFVKFCSCKLDRVFRKYFNSKYYEVNSEMSRSSTFSYHSDCKPNAFIYHPHCKEHCFFRKNKNDRCSCRYIPSVSIKNIHSYNSLVYQSMRDFELTPSNIETFKNVLDIVYNKKPIFTRTNSQDTGTDTNQKIEPNSATTDGRKNNINGFTNITKHKTHLYIHLALMNLQSPALVDSKGRRFYYIFDCFGGTKRIMPQSMNKYPRNKHGPHRRTKTRSKNKHEIFVSGQGKTGMKKTTNKENGRPENTTEIHKDLANIENACLNNISVNKKDASLPFIQATLDEESDQTQATVERNYQAQTSIDDGYQTQTSVDVSDQYVQKAQKQKKRDKSRRAKKENLSHDEIKISIVFEIRLYFYQRPCVIHNNPAADLFISSFFDRDNVFYNNETLYENYLWPNVCNIKDKEEDTSKLDPFEIDFWYCGIDLIKFFNGNNQSSPDSLARSFTLRSVSAWNYLIDIRLPFTLFFKNSSSLTLTALLSNSLAATIVLNGHCTDPNMFLNGFTLTIPIQIDCINLEMNQKKNIINIDKVYYYVLKQGCNYHVTFNSLFFLIDYSGLGYYVTKEFNDWSKLMNSFLFFVLKKNNRILFTDLLEFYHATKNPNDAEKQKNAVVPTKNKIFTDYYVEKFSSPFVFQIVNTLNGGDVNIFFKDIPGSFFYKNASLLGKDAVARYALLILKKILNPKNESIMDYIKKIFQKLVLNCTDIVSKTFVNSDHSILNDDAICSMNGI